MVRVLQEITFVPLAKVNAQESVLVATYSDGCKRAERWVANILMDGVKVGNFLFLDNYSTSQFLSDYE